MVRRVSKTQEETEMARRGENIHKRKDGRWEGRYIKARTSEGKIQWGYVYGTVYAEVKRVLIQKKAEAGFYNLKRTDLIFEALAEVWLHSLKNGIKESTYAGLSQSNYWKYENHTSGSLKNELPGVPKSNGSNTEKINKTDNSETDLIYPAELQEEEQYRRYFKEVLELEILEQGYPADKAVLHEILELLVETVTSRKKFLRICGEEKPKEVVKSRLMKLDSSHIQYILECLKENSTQIRNIKQYLLATLYNAPVTVDSYYSAQVRHEFGWGSRVDKN